MYDSRIERCNISDGCIIVKSDLNRCVIGIRSVIRENTHLRNVIMMGADFYESLEEIEESYASGIPPIGIGKNCTIENAIIDKNARIGENCVLKPDGKPDMWEQGGLFVRDGVLIVTKGAVIPSNTVV